MATRQARARAVKIVGPVHEPMVLLPSLARAKHPVTGQPMVSWVRALPRIRRYRTGWGVLAFGADPLGQLAAAGFSLTPENTEVLSAELPLADVHPDDEDLALIYPRLLGIAACAEMLGPLGTVLPGGVMTAPAALVRDLPVLVTRELAHQIDPPEPWTLPNLPTDVRQAAARLAESQSMDGFEDDYKLVTSHVGDLPDWFGVDLDPHQRTGSVAAVAGHSAICDPPGVGKTLSILAALAISGSKRSIIVTPPFPVVTHWEREVAKSKLAQNCGPGGRVVVLRTGRKFPPLPPCGVVLVPDTLLAARPEVIDMLADWQPEGFAVDEVHRIKTWDGLRSKAVRRMASQCTGIRLAATGTPMFANVDEMAPMMAITGHLRQVFGGLERYRADFCYLNQFDRYVSRKRELARLKALLDEHVWVRRKKVMSVAKRRYVEFIDPDETILRRANADVHATIDRFLSRFHRQFNRSPDDAEIAEWAQGELGLITQMRRAAGLAKVEGIAQRAAEWVTGYTEIDNETSALTYTRPLIIWTYHQEVSEALAKAVPAKIGQAGVIIGSTKNAERSRLVDEYQAGRIPVLVCSIPTVGVGVTLTRSADVFFAESSWTNAEVSQAEDRCVLEGQEVQTLAGPVPIEQVKVGDLVLTHRGNWRPVTDTWSRSAGNGVTKRVLTEVKYHGRRDPLVVTADHEIYLRRSDGRLEWAAAESVRPGDSVGTPRIDGAGLPTLQFPDRLRRWTHAEISASRRCMSCGAAVLARGLCTKHYRQFQSNHRRLGTPMPTYDRAPNGRYVPAPADVALDDDFLYLCGWYIAEGFASVRGGKGSFISLSGHRNETPIVERLGRYLKDTFGANWSIYSKENSQGVEFRAYSHDLAAWFLELFGHTAHHKELPAWVWDLDSTQRAVLFGAYVDGDGHRRMRTDMINPSWSWNTASWTLSNQMTLLAGSLGFKAGVALTRPNVTTVNGYDVHTGVNYHSGFTLDAKTEDMIWRPVTTVTHRFAKKHERLWDLSVADDESYTVAVAAVHNCHRRGQTRDVRVTTFIAPGTLDERIQNVLARKAEELDVIMEGGDNQVGVLSESTHDEQTAILVAMVRDRERQLHRSSGQKRAA